MPDISVITPWLDRPEFIADYERAMSTPGIEAIVVDNGSADSNAAELRAMVKRLGGKYIRNEANHWFAPANNQGLAIATGRIILFLNNDIAAEPAWLDCVRRDVGLGALYGPVILSLDVAGRTVLSHEGWCVAGLRQTWDALGGWDAEHHSMPFWEDRDLGFRAASMGLKLVKTDWPIRHKGAGTKENVSGLAPGFERSKTNLFARVLGKPLIGRHPLASAPASLESATILLNEGYLPEAEQKFHELVKASPQTAIAWERYAEVLHLSGRHEAATRALRRAIELAPDSLNIRINLGTLLGRTNQHDQAVAVLREAVERAPQSHEAHANLSRALLAVGSPQQAVTAAARAAELQPGFAPAYVNFSNALRELGKFSQALAAAHRATQLAPRSAAAFNALGVVLRARNQPREALSAFQQTLAFAPDNLAAQKNRTELLALLAAGHSDRK